VYRSRLLSHALPNLNNSRSWGLCWRPLSAWRRAPRWMSVSHSASKTNRLPAVEPVPEPPGTPAAGEIGFLFSECCVESFQAGRTVFNACSLPLSRFSIASMRPTMVAGKLGPLLITAATLGISSRRGHRAIGPSRLMSLPQSQAAPRIRLLPCAFHYDCA